MKTRILQLATLMLSLVSGMVTAQTAVPNVFQAGTPARATEVNENFNTLVGESNDQDVRIAALEAASSVAVSDQLICVVHHQWPIDGTAYNCVTRSDPTNVIPMTYAQVAQDGWVAVSVGGDTNNRVTYIFSK